MTGKEVAARSLDLVARGIDLMSSGIDLLTVLSETSNSSSPLYRLAVEFGRWLERENLNQWQLQNCLKEARDLVQPNFHGQQFFDILSSGTRSRAVGPLFVQPHGSLGRYLARDPHLRWMTSTISCLFEYHSERFISDVLCALIMQARLSQANKALSEYQLAYHPFRLQIKPVIDKIVSSIWLNIVNSIGLEELSSGILRLPKELQDICPKGHHLESHMLGLVMNRLLDPPPEVIIESEHLLGNLALWLFNHFHGSLRVVVSGAVIYERKLGESKSQIELRTKRFCDKDGGCKSERAVPVFKLYTAVGGEFKSNILGGKYDTQMTLESVPRVRQKLYKSPASYPEGTGMHSLKIRTKSAARNIMTWLLDRKIDRNVGNDLSFKLREDCSNAEKAEALLVADLLARIPQIRSTDWDDVDTASVIFSVPNKYTGPTVEQVLHSDASDDEIANSTMEWEDQDETDERRPEDCLLYFPILRDLLEKVKNSCMCHICRQKEPRSKFQLSPGCLQHTTFFEVMFYIGHGIADAFGAPDASASSATQLESMGVVEILLEAAEGEFKWHSWLNTASRVFLGCPSLRQFTEPTESDIHYGDKAHFSESQLFASNAVALQYGNLAVVAPWVDLAKPVTTRGCFGFIIAKGSLGIVAEGNGGQLQFQSVEGEVAIIETHLTEETSDYVERYPKEPEPADSEIVVPSDISSVESDYILVSAGPARYKLLMRVSSGSHSRLIDPSRAMLKISQGIPTITCKHSPSRTAHSPTPPNALKLYPFDELLGRWSATPTPKGDDSNQSMDELMEQAQFDEQGYIVPKPSDVPPDSDTAKANLKPTCRSSYFLDTYFKYNVALALTDSDVTVVNHESACFACTLDKVFCIEAVNGIENPNHDRWVINRASNTATLRPRERYLPPPEPKKKRKIEATEVGDMELDIIE